MRAKREEDVDADLIDSDDSDITDSRDSYTDSESFISESESESESWSHASSSYTGSESDIPASEFYSESVSDNETKEVDRAAHYSLTLTISPNPTRTSQ